jgi:uncharacterized protein YdbL (DUF1318 family)
MSLSSNVPCLVLLLAGCVTVNISFPPRAVERAAQVIVGEARPEGSADAGGNGQSGQPGDQAGQPGEPQSPPQEGGQPAPASGQERGDGPRSASRMQLVSFSPPEDRKDEKKARDDDIRINIDTPVIREIRSSLQKRFEKLRPLYEKGAIGESLDGYLGVRDDAKLTLLEKRDLKQLVEEENRDRRNLYLEIVKANRFEEDRLKDVQRIFAAQWREKSRTGWWIQNAGGEWVRKPPPKDQKKAPPGKKSA